MARHLAREIGDRGSASAGPGRFGALAEQELRSLLDRLSDGVAVVDRTGVIVATNAAFRRLVALRPGVPEPTCCTVFGCRLPANAGLGGCVIDRVLACEEGVQGLRLELPGAAGTVWLSGAPLHGRRELAVVELRAADRPAPRFRGAVANAPTIHVRALGRMQVERPDGVVRGGWLDQRPGQLLKFLVAERRRVVSIEDIAEALWPTAEFATVNTVRHLVHVLRERLEPDRRDRSSASRTASCIVSSRGGYALDRSRVTIDADEFDDVAARALGAYAAGDEAAEPALDRALSLYRGDFVGDDLYAAWAHTERERLRGLVERVLQALVDLAEARDDVAAATSHVERLTELEPFDSAPQRQLIVLSLREGHRGRALRQYEAFDLRMQRAFGERADFSFEELMRSARPPGPT
jgi:DNA-binding SARP family transcriptional activator